MGLIISAAGAAVMVLGIVLFILQAGKISSQAKKDADREKPVMDEEARKHCAAHCGQRWARRGAAWRYGWIR